MRFKVDHKGRGVFSPLIVQQSPPNKFWFGVSHSGSTIIYLNLLTASSFPPDWYTGSIRFRFYSTDKYETKSVIFNYTLSYIYTSTNDFRDIFSVPYDPYIDPIDDPLLIENDDPTALRLFLDNNYDNPYALTLFNGYNVVNQLLSSNEFKYILKTKNTPVNYTPTLELRFPNLKTFNKLLSAFVWSTEGFFKVLNISTSFNSLLNSIKNFFIKTIIKTRSLIKSTLVNKTFFKTLTGYTPVNYVLRFYQQIIKQVRFVGKIIYSTLEPYVTTRLLSFKKYLNLIANQTQRLIKLTIRTIKLNYKTTIDRIIGLFFRGTNIYASYDIPHFDRRLLKIQEVIRTTRNFFPSFQGNILLTSVKKTQNFLLDFNQLRQILIAYHRTGNTVKNKTRAIYRQLFKTINKHTLRRAIIAGNRTNIISRKVESPINYWINATQINTSPVISRKPLISSMYGKHRWLTYKWVYSQSVNHTLNQEYNLINYRVGYSYSLYRDKIYGFINLSYNTEPFYRKETIMNAFKEAVRNIFYGKTLSVVPVNSYYPEFNVTHPSFSLYVVTGSGGDLTQTVSMIDEQFDGNIYSITFSGFFMNNIPPDIAEYILMYDYNSGDIITHMYIGKDYIDSINDYSSISVPHLYLIFYFG